MSTARANRRVAEALFATLAEHGVREVIVSPGSRSTPLVLAADSHDALRTHVVLDERAAAFIALGAAKASGRPVALVCTSGSAGANYLPAVVEAAQAGLPLVMLTADRPPELHHVGAPQTMPQNQLFTGYVRFASVAGVPGSGLGEGTDERAVMRLAALAIDAATGPRPGPVHLNLPFREPLWDPADDAPVPSLAPPRVWRASACAADDMVVSLASELSGAAGLIVCGPRLDAIEPGWAEVIDDLAERLAWPILADPASGVRYCGRHVVPTYDAILDALGGGDSSASRSLIPTPEVVLHFGRALTSKAATRWLAEVARDRVIAVSPHGTWNDPGLATRAMVVAEPVALCRALIQALPDPPTPIAITEAWRRLDMAARGALEVACTGAWSGPFTRATLAATQRSHALFVSSSMAIRDLDRFGASLPAECGETPILTNRGVNGIDGVVASAAGAALVGGPGGSPRPMTVLIGDLAFLHDLDGLAAAVALHVSLTIVVFDNGGGGIFDQLAISDHPSAFERYFLTPSPHSVSAVSDGLALPCTTVASPAALRGALAETSKGPRAIRVVIDRGLDAECRAAARVEVRRAIEEAR